MERGLAHGGDDVGVELDEVDPRHPLGLERAERDARAQAHEERAAHGLVARELFRRDEAGHVAQEELRPHVLGAGAGVDLAVELEVEPAFLGPRDEDGAEKALAVKEALVARAPAAATGSALRVEVSAAVDPQRVPARDRAAETEHREREHDGKSSHTPEVLRETRLREQECAPRERGEDGGRPRRALDPERGQEERAARDRARDGADRVPGEAVPTVRPTCSRSLTVACATSGNAAPRRNAGPATSGNATANCAAACASEPGAVAVTIGRSAIGRSARRAAASRSR